jgi:NAD+ synthase (glutamine-hydrolysing)
LGCEAGRIIYDGGALLASGGRLIAVGDRFSFKDVLVTSAVVDLAQTRMGHARTASFQPDLKQEGGSLCVPGEFEWPSTGLSASKVSPAGWESSPEIKKEEFTRAVTLGLFDYLRKTRAQGFVVSLSGGADSSAVACLVALMAERGVAELGREGFAQAISHIESARRAQDARQAVRALLTTVYQPTRHSSRTTRSAASEVADSLGARHLEMDVDLLVEQYVEIVSHKIGHQFTWETDDMALQNIQARVRAPGVWLVANERNAILLTTSNRSEAAVGYATMDGDTCGGLCPIGGIDKAFLREWLGWMEREGPQGLHPFPALKAVNAQQPTAELRPSEQGQTDEGDLMPYQLLDTIERLAIRDKKTPLEVFLSIRAEFPGRYPDQALGVWVERFFRLWCRNQWKRERYAPSFHLDDENLDPKTWCRFPILSGNYDRELEELKDFLRATAAPAARPASASLKKP